MKAWQLIKQGSPGTFVLHDIAIPEPKQGEALIRVRACGLNRLDLWLEQGTLPVPQTLPRTPGGEIAGEIVALGPNSPGWNVGDRVAVQSNLFCGECEFCRAGDESVCLRGQLLGVHQDGGLAEAVVAPIRALVALPGSLDFISSAALTLAGSTAMHMLTRRTQVHPEQTVLVMGASSGVGSAAIQIARALGARVLTTGSSPEKRALGLRLGAEAAIDSTLPDWPAEVRRLTARRGVDCVVEHIGGPALEQAFLCLARGGTIVTCGATAGREISLPLWPFFVKEHRLIGSYGRSRADITQTLAWAAAGRLRPVVHRTFPLSETGAALAMLQERQVLGKVVVEP